MDKEAKAIEAMKEFMEVQTVISVELKHPMQHGKREVNFLDITTPGYTIGDGVLSVPTDVEGRAEHFPMENVVKWRIDRYFVPFLDKHNHEYGSYEYTPYTYPERVGDYLGSYSNSSGCIAFLDSDMQITMMKDLEA